MITLLNSNYQQLSKSPNANTTSPVKETPITNPASLNQAAVRVSLSPEAQKYLKKDSADRGFASTRPENQNPLSKEKWNSPDKLSPEQMNLVQKLKSRDIHVKAHEAAHMAVAGAYARGGASYDYQTGPDKKQYAVGGEIQLDTSPIPDDPNATIAKAEIIRKGALAPVDPSGADLSVAAAAGQMEAQARQELSANLLKTSSKTSTDTGRHSQMNPAGSGRQAKISAYRRFINQPKIGQFFNQSA